MQRLTQSPTDPDFVQNPYPFYERARAAGDLIFWEEYGLACAATHAAVQGVLKDRRMGREAPPEKAPPIPDHLRPFYAVEAHSMLELEPPRHTRLRSLVLRAFTSRQIASLEPQIDALCHTLIDRFPSGRFDLLQLYAQRVPVIVIARLLGVDEARADDLLAWSNAMVAMYQARRDQATEAAAVAATQDFTAFLREEITQRRKAPGNDLLSALIAAEEDGQRLSTDELMSTCILLLNAGHEATVHTMGNGIKALLESGTPKITEGTVEEILRFDPPLHMFTRWIYEDLTLFGHSFKRGDQIAALLGSAGRDGAVWSEASTFTPTRAIKPHSAFGAGIHFCVGAPLARLELLVGLRVLFDRCPALALAETPKYANVYHFHGLKRLMVTT